MVDISRLGQPHDRVDEDVRSSLSGGTDGQFPMSPVHRVPGLESDYLPPCDFLEVGSEFGGCISESNVIIVCRSFYRLDRTTDVKFVYRFTKIRNCRMSNIVRAHDLLRFERFVRPVNVGYGDNGKSGFVSGVTEGEAGTGGDREGRDGFGGNVECDRHGEEGTLTLSVDFGKTESVSNATPHQRMVSPLL